MINATQFLAMSCAQLEIQEGIGQGFEVDERQNLDAGLLLGGQGAEAALQTDRNC